MILFISFTRNYSLVRKRT